MISFYIIYMLISLYVTIWVGYKINKLGEVFLYEIFKENVSIVKPLNRLLLIGYYLINIGYVCILLRNNSSSNLLIEALADKLGIVIFTLGVIHLLNLLIFSIIYKLKSNVQST